MDEIIKQVIEQAPSVGVLIVVVWWLLGQLKTELADNREQWRLLYDAIQELTKELRSSKPAD